MVQKGLETWLGGGVKRAVPQLQPGAGLVNQGWEMSSKPRSPRRSRHPQGRFAAAWPWCWSGARCAQSCGTHRPAPGTSGRSTCPACAEPPKSLHICFLPATTDGGYSWETQPTVGIGRAQSLGGGGGGTRARGWTLVVFQGRYLCCFLSTSFAPGKNRNDVYASNVRRPEKSCDRWLLMLGKSPLSLFAPWRTRWSITAGVADHHRAFFAGVGSSLGTASWKPKCCRAAGKCCYFCF